MRLSKMPGLYVMQDGKTVGRVERLCFSPDGQTAAGLWVRRKSFFRKNAYAALSDVRLFGEHTLTVSQCRSGVKKKSADLIGQTVRDTSGVLLGWVTDGLLEEGTGQVCAIEVSFGLLEDFTRGRTFLSDFILRPEGVVVPSGAAES